MKPNKKSAVKKSSAKKSALKRKPTVKKALRKKGNKKPKSDCYITSACVKFYGLKDNCEQLTIVRNFRDRQLLGSSAGRSLVTEYYKIAPKIVSRIESDPESYLIYDRIYSEIEVTVKAIKEGKYKKAVEVYTRATKRLIKRFKL